MLSSQRSQPLALIQGDHGIPALGEREGHLSRATSNLEDPALGWERRKGNDVLD